MLPVECQKTYFANSGCVRTRELTFDRMNVFAFFALEKVGPFHDPNGRFVRQFAAAARAWAWLDTGTQHGALQFREGKRPQREWFKSN